MGHGTGAAVVIHHKNYPQVLATISDVCDAVAHVVVVDNSADEEIARRLELDAVRLGFHLIATSNNGYGAAANAGVSEMRRQWPDTELFGVFTHDVRLAPCALDHLAEVLRTNPRVGAVAPVTNNGETGEIWSMGGIYGRLVGARHRRFVTDHVRVQLVDWFDGAVGVYREAAFPRAGFDETYFMYCEELDLHLRMGDQGWLIAVDTHAVASQTTNGMPLRAEISNGVLVARRRFGRSRMAAALGRTVGRELLRAARDRHFEVSQAAAAREGLRDLKKSLARS